MDVGGKFGRENIIIIFRLITHMTLLAFVYPGVITTPLGANTDICISLVCVLLLPLLNVYVYLFCPYISVPWYYMILYGIPWYTMTLHGQS